MNHHTQLTYSATQSQTGRFLSLVFILLARRTSGAAMGANWSAGFKHVFSRLVLLALLLMGAAGFTPANAQTFTNKTTADGLGADFVRDVFASGTTVYAATNGGGLSISTDGGATFTNRTTANGLGDNIVFGVFASGTTVYAATSGGLSISTDGGATFTNRTTANGLGINQVLGVFASGTTVYAATGGGVSISTDGGATFTNRTTANGLGDNYVNRVFASGATVYAATDGGLAISTDGGATFTNRTTANGLGSDSVNHVFASGTTVYAATNGGGLAISTNGGTTFTNRTTADGLGGDFVRGVFASGSTVYAATTGGGLSISTDGGATFTNRTTANGLGSDVVFRVFASGTTVYAATLGGVSISIPATAPSATTNAASSVGQTGATLNGTINDNGASTTVTFDYGTTNAYGTNVAATTGGTVSAGSGSTAAAVTLTGLTCNTTYHFRVKGVNSVNTTNGSDATFTTTACTVIGACGTSANVSTAFLPTANLCTAGTASTVTSGTSSWAWSCAGTGPSATNATCSAPYPPVNGGSGAVGAIQAQSANGWQINQAASGFVALPAPAPAGVTLPGGASKVVLNTGTAGTSATVTLRFSSIPAGAQLYKYGKENGIGDTNKWFPFPATIDAAAGTVTYTLTDGQRGDNDWTANSVIDDPVALGVGGGAGIAGVPTLSQWAMMLLAGLMALATFLTLRRRTV